MNKNNLKMLFKGIYSKLEFIFAVIAMTTGIILILTMPKATGLSWDDEIHYARVLSLCSLVDEAKYEADGRLIANQEEVVTTLLRQKYSFETEREINKELNSLYANKTSVSEENDFTYTFGIYCPAYVVQAGLVLLGRLLNLPYIAVFQLGKLGTLITYVLLMFFAIRKLRYGKALLTVFALIPTNLFLAANYSYDPWVTAWITLGYAFFIAELQNPDRPLSLRNFLMMMACFILGCMPKAIYFTLMFPLLFMPGKKFKDKKTRVIYIVSICFVAFLLLASFMLPKLIHGFGSGDARGGRRVNSTKQVEYIMANPWTFTKMFIGFMLYYINPYYADSYLTNMSYMGRGFYFEYIIMVLVFLVFFDREKATQPKEKQIKRNAMVLRVATYIGALGAISLAMLAMYVSFTAVGLDSILGVQGRYLLPLLFPVLYFTGIDGIKIEFEKNIMAVISIAIIMAVFYVDYVELYSNILH